jgi:hypothetical protein
LESFDCNDGFVYAWEHAWNDNSQGGRWCRWEYSDATWGDDCGNFRNLASSLQNNSSGGNAINFYFHTEHTGAWACLGRGDVWRDLSLGIHFSWGYDRDGYGRGANDEIASSKWVRYCGLT